MCPCREKIYTHPHTHPHDDGGASEERERESECGSIVGAGGARKENNRRAGVRVGGWVGCVAHALVRVSGVGWDGG